MMSNLFLINDNGEGPSTGHQFHATLPQHFRVTESAETTTAGSVIDTPMDETSTSDDVPEQSDWEYDSHYSSIPEEEDWHPSDSRIDAPEYECRAMDNPVHMGEAIEFVFPVKMEYDVDDQEHIFEDGLDGDESEDSEASTNYEELTEPDVVCTVVEVTAEEGGDEEEEDIESVDAADESYESGSDDEDSYESDSGETLNADVNVAEQSAMVGQQSSTPQVNPLPRAEINHPSPAPMILNQLLAKDLELKIQEKERDTSHWRLLELQEALRNIEREIPVAEAAFQVAEAAIISRNTERLADIIASGLSVELYEAYQDFCESLHPEFGLRDGFSITCSQPHSGSYFDYDPELSIFKEHVEMDYNTCNFRCEAGRERVSCYRPLEIDDVLGFWPIRCPEPRTGLETTWGEQYPELYSLAIQAAKRGSGAAMELLMKLPISDGLLSGWMLEYQFEAMLASEPLISRRWVFKQAQNIDEPVTEEEKRRRLTRLLAA